MQCLLFLRAVLNVTHNCISQVDILFIVFVYLLGLVSINKNVTATILWKWLFRSFGNIMSVIV